MNWYPDELDIPVEKPDELLTLENEDPAVLEAMTTEEMRIHMHEVAQGFVKKAEIRFGSDYEQLLLVVTTAMKRTGQNLARGAPRFGQMMMTGSAHYAKLACKEQFPQKGELEK